MNRLAGQISPYLLQHADNPVEWYPWGDEVLARATEEDKPLFVSIGYASCHWCHVMAHESFEDARIAALLAESFLSVKVDREERPDIDAIYMASVVAINGSGGWPLSVFCTPDGRPFFGGTYFPPTDRHGMPSFERLLVSLATAWKDRRTEVEQQADALLVAVTDEVRLVDHLNAPQSGSGDLDSANSTADVLPPIRYDDALEHTVRGLSERFDPIWGGFGPAPKFPRPTLVELCLRHHLATGDSNSLLMATTTLDAMAAGGMYDHLAGGFARYSTDERWLVPHFEKMLTDQALLSRTYLHAWQVTRHARYLQVLEETLDYVVGEMAVSTGGFHSSEDADAGGIEGSHATFTSAQVTEALESQGAAELVERALEWYGVTPEGNWEGTTVLCRPLGTLPARTEDMERARRILLEARRRRPQPARDTKILTEWNAMMASVVAEAAGATGNETWADSAIAVGEFLWMELRDSDGRWRRTFDGTLPAFAADHAWLIDLATRLGELTGEAVWTDRACEVADVLLTLFWDGEAGGLFTSGQDAPALIVRGKEFIDGAVPSANAVAAHALLRLASLTGDDRLRIHGERIVELAGPLLRTHPSALADMVVASALTEGATEIVVTGSRADLVDVVRARWLPTAVLAWGERRDGPLWDERSDGLAYICRDFSCLTPTDDASTLESMLDQGHYSFVPPSEPKGR